MWEIISMIYNIWPEYRKPKIILTLNPQIICKSPILARTNFKTRQRHPQTFNIGYFWPLSRFGRWLSHFFFIGIENVLKIKKKNNRSSSDLFLHHSNTSTMDHLVVSQHCIIQVLESSWNKTKICLDSFTLIISS